MIIEWIIIAIAFLALRQDERRFPAALIFAASLLIHDRFLAELDGLLYYGSAAIFDLAVITWLANLRQTCKLTVNLLRVSLVSIVLNFGGWLMWITYQPPALYNLSYIILYSCAIVALINKEGLKHGGYTLDGWASCFRVHPGKSVPYSSKL